MAPQHTNCSFEESGCSKTVALNPRDRNFYTQFGKIVAEGLGAIAAVLLVA